jgi:hypothetical protein
VAFTGLPQAIPRRRMARSMAMEGELVRESYIRPAMRTG